MKPVKTSKDRAAVLARLTESAKEQQAGAGERGQQPSVAVKILTAIPAGDSGQKAAMLMARNGGALQETGQPVLVRHVGEGSVSAGAIVTPEPCGRLGLCFTRSVQVVQAGVSFYRPLVATGPIPAEGGIVSEFTHPWKFGQFLLPYFKPWPLAGTGYYLECDFSQLPTERSPYGWAWLKKAQPFRLSLTDYANSYSPDYYALQRGRNPFFSGMGILGIGESAAVGVSGHLSPVLFNSIVAHTAGFFVTSSASTNSISTPEQPTPKTDRAFISRGRVRYSRITIDGVDVTGIREHAFPFQPGYYLQGEIGGEIPEAEYLGKAAYIDVWAEYYVELSNFTFDPLEIIPPDGTIAATRQVAWIDADNAGQPCKMTSVNYSQSLPVTGSKFQLEFDSNGPFGVSSLVMESNTLTGWVFSISGNVQQVRKQSISSPPATGDSQVRISFNWMESDRPLLTYYRQVYSSTSGWSGRNWYYRPVATADFAGTLSPSGFNVKHGAWNPASPNDFRLFGADSLSVGGSYEFRNAGDGIIPKADWLAVPQTITVTKV